MSSNNKLENKVIDFLGGLNNIIYFVIYFVCGFTAHMGIWTYKVASTDTNFNGLFYYTPDWEISLGRWLIPVMDKIRYYFCFPIFSTILSLVYISISIVIILNLLEIKDAVIRIFSGILLIVTPCISFSLMFYYCSDSYAMSMLLASLFVYIIKKDISIRNIILSIIFIIGSLALYQAYVGYAATLCMSLLILYLLKNKELVFVVKKAVYMLACALTGTILYYIITKIIHAITGIQFANYAGANALSKTTIMDIKNAIAISYQKFYELFFGYMGLESTSFFRSRELFILIVLCSFTAMLVIIVQSKLYKDPVRILLLICCLIAYPFANGIILLIVKSHGMHNLMIQSYYVIFILFAAIIEMYQNNGFSKIKWINPFVITSFFVILVIGFSFELLAVNNATYEYFNIKRNKMDSIANRILVEAENLDGYDEDVEFVFAGKLDSSYPIDTYLEKMSFSGADILDANNLFQNNAIIENIYREDLGCYIHLCNDDLYKMIVTSDEYEKMPIYPEKGSVKLLNNIVVVKLSDEVFMPEE